MQRVPVSSSQIKSVGYDPATARMEVEFANDGGVYVYDNVPLSKYEALLNADSVGSLFHQTIKGKHPHRKV